MYVHLQLQIILITHYWASLWVACGQLIKWVVVCPSKSHLSSLAGYHDETSSFGMMKKGVYKPSSDFNFDFVAEVLCSNPHNSGYLVTVTSGRSQASNTTESTRY